MAEKLKLYYLIGSSFVVKAKDHNDDVNVEDKQHENETVVRTVVAKKYRSCSMHSFQRPEMRSVE